jgi:hypothetical protein
LSGEVAVVDEDHDFGYLFGYEVQLAASNDPAPK